MRTGIIKDESGQVMAEACLAIALLAFTWITASFAAFMNTNHIRTAMAARHAAWMHGNGGSPTPDNIGSDFFFQGGVVDVQQIQSVGIGEFIAGKADTQKYNGQGNGPFRYTVSFGMDKADINTTTNYPFVLLKTELPFMPPSLPDRYIKVQSSCQWEEVNSTWTSLWTAIGWFFEQIFGEISDYFSL